jgi:hypothetical protein
VTGDDQVVGVAHQHPVAVDVSFPVQPVQVDVGQQRGNDSSHARGNFEFEATLPLVGAKGAKR